MSLDLLAREVLAHFAEVPPTTPLQALANHGGFSGARLWRVSAGNLMLCLRAWPPTGPSAERLRFIHGLMRSARDRGLGFVPAVFLTGGRQSLVVHAGRLWDLTQWLPGQSDFAAHPSPGRLETALTALAQVHAAWAEVQTVGPCPAVARRLTCAREWAELLGSGWRPDCASAVADPVRDWAERAWRLLPRHLPGLAEHLEPWRDRPQALQPCLCDVWHAHILFEGDDVSGLVDYGSLKMDHVAVDLARLLGSLVGDDTARRAAGLRAYRRVRPLTPEEEALAEVLDVTGTVLAAVNWLRWLYHEQRRYEDRSAVARRLAEVVLRLEGW
jgi:Ser/Thr protein kinase RdoA (MazF antagonist)